MPRGTPGGALRALGQSPGGVPRGGPGCRAASRVCQSTTRPHIVWLHRSMGGTGSGGNAVMFGLAQRFAARR